MVLKAGKDKKASHILYQEIWGIILIGLGIILVISLCFYEQKKDPFFDTNAGSMPGNYTGKLGALIARSFFFTFGLSSFMIPVILIITGILFIARRIPKKPALMLIYLAILLIAGSCILHIQTSLPLIKWFPYLTEQNNVGFGGIIGKELTESLLVPVFGRIGASIFLIMIFLAALLLITKVELYPYLKFFYHLFSKIILFFIGKIRDLFKSSKAEKGFGEKKRTGRIIGIGKKEESIIDNKEIVERNGSGGRKKTIEPKPVDPTPVVRKIVVPEPVKAKSAVKPRQIPSPAMRMEYGGYHLPPTDLLKHPEPVEEKELFENINRNSEILEQTLLNFGIEAKVGEIHRGPVITRYEVHPAPGVKVGKVVALADDIALAMKAPGVRIVAPIPGKSAIGIELPNKKSNVVCLREILESKEFQESKAAIPLALGKSIDGKVVIADLAVMPHLLIAGQTGSGKSVCINASIMTMLYSMRPDQVKFIMVDPKKIELAMYNVLPHLLVPVITDAKKVANGLNWLVVEMEKRYEYLAKAGVRNIESYNARPLERKEALELDEDNDEIKIPDRLPYIVAIIDELADLMMVSPQDVENAITRLAQLSRAVGIHLIIATQRPSVNVITGVIKANLPSRISFQVASKVDSRTVLDANGAEKLIGNGDSLFMPPGTAQLVRVQGTYVSDAEIQAVLDFVKQQAEPEFDHSILEKQEAASGGNVPGDDFEDELYDEAVEITLLSGQASASNLQRRLRIGYARAARLIDIMEERGVIGPARGSKPREIYASRTGEDFEDEDN